MVPQLLFSGTMVKFDKLNKSISSHEYVPILGDMMISRWAYEAMAVKQYRDNKYQENFFFLDKKKNEASYIASYLIPALYNKLSKITYQDNIEQKNKNIDLLHYELNRLNEFTPKYQFKDLDKITPEKFNESELALVKEHLETLTRYYQKLQNTAISLMDEKVAKLSEENGGKEYLIDLKNKYQNEFLSTLVLNKQEINKIYDAGDHFIQLMTPIYKDPVKHNGRAHFYASTKQVGQKQIDTYIFNILVMWIFSLVLYLLLVFDGLRRLIELFSFGEKR